MATPKVLILRAPGTNCEVETAYAFELAGAQTTLLHVNRLIESPQLAADHQILCFPGGFSYGDDIAAGRILAQQLKVHLSDTVNQFRDADHLVLGICNGFQIMMRLGIFFENPEHPPATLTLNRQNRFEDRWVHLASAASNCVFLQGIDRMYLPMAHAEGRMVLRNDDDGCRFAGTNQLCLRYAEEHGAVSNTQLPFPVNPNGSEMNVAGLSDASGRIFGLMPHPERHIEATHHPYWTRRAEQPAHGDGLALFQNAVNYFA
ncbi:MAG: phosphoribosylformylglycinamidine synthase subunit PurQ [Pirellulaceae bacterium]|nr:phosphoribosylformylglycinamidine synthase subunit PurQ [Pirellulaceae bacterium]